MTGKERVKELIRDIRVATHNLSVLDANDELRAKFNEFEWMELKELDAQLRNSMSLITHFRRVIDEVRNEQISDRKSVV